MVDPTTTAEECWAPRFPFDIDTARARVFEELKIQFDEWLKSEPIQTKLTLKTGWHDITSEMAEELLRRNRPGANRKASLATIQYYADQMRRYWPETGQPIIFNEHGILVDGQHRLWACLFSGVTFRTYVVTDVKAIPHLFAYIDNSKARNPAAALQTAGFNGVSAAIAAIIKIAVDIDTQLYTVSDAKTRKHRLAPVDFIHLMEKYPNAKMAARLAASDYEAAVELTEGKKDICGYLAMAIMDRFGQEMSDDFFTDLADTASEFDTDHPIARLRKLLEQQSHVEKQMKRHQLLGCMIKVFNAWRLGNTLGKNWTLKVDDEFPKISNEQAEEAA